ncbi:MAG TPA: energy transducer TonB [Alphaproteobacteria bacterium]|nr:energy transducer TonB [Alphaproteobacteria bacterium]
MLAAALLHVGLLWLALPYMVNRTEPLPDDPLDVAIVPPAPKPKPKPIRLPPAVRPAEKNSTAGRPHFQPASRLAHTVLPPVNLALPPPIPAKAPMTLPAAAASPAAGTPGNGSGVSGTGTGNGGQEGNDYLIRLKAYIDSHKGGRGHWDSRDVDVVLVLDPDGALTDIRVVASSGDPAIDDDVVSRLKRMSPFPKPPPILFSPLKQRLPVADKWIFAR